MPSGTGCRQAPPPPPALAAPDAAASASLCSLSMTRTLVISCTTVMSTPWVRSLSRLTTLSTKSSTISGHLVRHRAMARHAFFRR